LFLLLPLLRFLHHQVHTSAQSLSSYLYTNHSAYTSFFAVLPSTTGENKSFQESVFSSLITTALSSWTSFRL
jgi:hypothetical protein